MTSPDRCTSGSSYLLLGANTIPKAVEKHLHVGFVLGHSCVQKGGPNLEPRVDPIFGPSITNMKGFQKSGPFSVPKNGTHF